MAFDTLTGESTGLRIYVVHQEIPSWIRRIEQRTSRGDGRLRAVLWSKVHVVSGHSEQREGGEDSRSCYLCILLSVRPRRLAAVKPLRCDHAAPMICFSRECIIGRIISGAPRARFAGGTWCRCLPVKHWAAPRLIRSLMGDVASLWGASGARNACWTEHQAMVVGGEAGAVRSRHALHGGVAAGVRMLQPPVVSTVTASMVDRLAGFRPLT
ncbi:hypothetical protein C8R43DRAFT_1136187 [Mycena crocata]|nr:hypothetical protein C8R43DRAFT_1136187 [Mycena crocata]